MAGRGAAEGREGPSLQELEALLDAKEREFALQMQRLREQLSQVIGQQPSNHAAFTGWQGLAKRSQAPGELGQMWGALGQPMMGALWKNRDLEIENRRLREAVARKQSQLQSLQQGGSSSAGARHAMFSVDASWPPRGASASSDDKARSSQAAQSGLPLELSASNLSAASSSSTTGANGAGASTDMSRGNVSPAVASTPMFGSVAGQPPELDLLPEFSVAGTTSSQPSQKHMPPAASQQPQIPPVLPVPSSQPQPAGAIVARKGLQHSDTKTKLEDTLRELADNIGTTLPPKSAAPPELERKESKPSGPLARSESFPASAISEPNHVEGCSKDVQGYGNPAVYQNWRKGHVKEEAEGNNENGEAAASVSAGSSRTDAA